MTLCCPLRHDRFDSGRGESFRCVARLAAAFEIYPHEVIERAEAILARAAPPIATVHAIRPPADLAAYPAPAAGTELEQWDAAHASDGEEFQDHSHDDLA